MNRMTPCECIFCWTVSGIHVFAARLDLQIVLLRLSQGTGIYSQDAVLRAAAIAGVGGQA